MKVILQGRVTPSVFHTEIRRANKTEELKDDAVNDGKWKFHKMDQSPATSKVRKYKEIYYE